MHNWLQSIKTDNAFARRDYLLSVPAIILCAMQAHIAVVRHIRDPEHWVLNLFTLCFYCAIILLPAFYHRWARAVTTGYLALMVISCGFGMWCPDWQTGLRVGIAFIQFGILTIVLWIRAANQRTCLGPIHPRGNQ